MWAHQSMVGQHEGFASRRHVRDIDLCCPLAVDATAAAAAEGYLPPYPERLLSAGAADQLHRGDAETDRLPGGLQLLSAIT